MDRRAFLQSLSIVLASAAVEKIPNGRVWSFPSQIVIPKREIIVPNFNADILEIVTVQRSGNRYLHTSESVGRHIFLNGGIGQIVFEKEIKDNTARRTVLRADEVADRFRALLPDSSLITQPVVNSRSLVD